MLKLFCNIYHIIRICLKYLLRKKVTVQYPNQRSPISSQIRGEHALLRDERGEERCIACKLCEVICPAQAISIVAYPIDQAEHRSAEIYDIDMTKCIYCGLCEQACPVNAIVQTPALDFSTYTKAELMYDKKKLLSNGDKWQQILADNKQFYPKNSLPIESYRGD